ncbi:unnamed protein product [Macrosiphum euphorbiae]|uniref:DUF6570 domain-containing protein n=1 Tax=Macrosiphum euphorbiae TaxID=13131 RepID=A0AAV0VL14_9HEMI|nr:unnamed protein product [Macrosiphum euphorbiae]
MLPRSTHEAGIIVVTERLENLNITRQWSINREKVFKALYWLIKNNPLYKCVQVNHNVELNEEDLIRITQTTKNIGVNQPQEKAYKYINELSRILRASWHQNSSEIFKSDHARGSVLCYSAFKYY